MRSNFAIEQHNHTTVKMDKAKEAVDSVVDGLKKVTVGDGAKKEKKPKVKKEKSGAGGADGGAESVWHNDFQRVSTIS